MTIPIILLVLWAVLSFLLHNLIHEGAHALVAVSARAGPVKLWPFPGWRLGYFTWAHMRMAKPIPFTWRDTFYGAPIFAEASWFIGFAFLSYYATGWWRFFVIIEMSYAVIDMLVWHLGIWTQNPYSDAEHFRKAFGWSTTYARFRSSFIVLDIAAVVFFSWRMFV